MSLHEELKNNRPLYVVVDVVHISDGHIIRRTMSVPPAKGEWIVVSKDTYVVKQVIWNYNDARTVTVMVGDPED